MITVSQFQTYRPPAVRARAHWVCGGIPFIEISHQRYVSRPRCLIEERDMMPISSCRTITWQNIVWCWFNDHVRLIHFADFYAPHVPAGYAVCKQLILSA